MIRALEEHLAAWVRQVASESDSLLGAPVMIAGSLDPTAVPEGQTGILVEVRRLLQAPEHRDLGPAPVDQDDRSRLQAEIGVLLVGPADGTTGLTVAPPGATVHQMDLLALTVLARLRERSQPGADGDADWHGGSRGRITAAAGGRESELKWEAVEAGDPVTVTEAANRRIWQLCLHATIEYRFAALPLDGGRIRAIRLQSDFVPADRLPLSYFAGVDGALLQKLNGAGFHRLGDLAGVDGAALATQLQLVDPDRSRVVTDLVAVATTRQVFTAAVSFTDTLSEVLWLPARAFIDPTAAEAAILNRVRQRPMEAITLAVLGLGTAVILRPDQLETVLVGRLLAREGGA